VQIAKNEEIKQNLYAEVALPLPLRQTFTYSLASNICENAKLGARLLVPFGKRQLTGYIVALHQELQTDLELSESQIKPATELLDDDPLVTPEILRLTQWTADYYSASWGEVLKASLPAGVNVDSEVVVQITSDGRIELAKITNMRTSKAEILQHLAENLEVSKGDLEKKFGKSSVQRNLRELEKRNLITTFQRTISTKAKPKRRKAVRLLPIELHTESIKPLSEAQSRIIDVLTSENGEIGFVELLEMADVSASSIQTLEKRNIVEIFVHEVFRDPMRTSKIPENQILTPTDEQSSVLSTLTTTLNANTYETFVLHGVTGSGKTEIYIRAMKVALESGKSSLMMVPEIALTPVFSKRLRAVFGDEVAILHSKLSVGERFDEWRRIKGGSARIVIGTRSAIFAPLENIGLIIVDEEHDGSYRQHESPFYHARDVAVVRGNFAKAIVVLGSATPSLETFYNAEIGKYKLLSLPNRIGNRPLAKAELIDMREVFKEKGKDQVLSPQLLTAIRQTYNSGEQTIILLNRRGFSAFVLCRSCGDAIRCKNCDITLTFHKRDNSLVCHYCGYREKVPKVCPACDSKFINFLGEGTEQLETILQEYFPDLRIERIDRDTMNRRNALENILDEFSDKKIDMLLGTQMLAKGHDFPNVTLVGVLAIDASLSIPDFRTAERTFQLLTQVAGRAGRGSLPGRVLIQTYCPQHYVLQQAETQNYLSFYEKESKFRKNLNYPPYVALASLLIHHENFDYAYEQSQILREALQDSNSNRESRVLGPAPAPLARLKGEYRMQIIVKSANRKKLREFLEFAMHEAQTKSLDLRCVDIEIDPSNLS
jgi:primosomal protein N' (replication factor Y) (superfamily II helicase)